MTRVPAPARCGGVYPGNYSGHGAAPVSITQKGLSKKKRMRTFDEQVLLFTAEAVGHFRALTFGAVCPQQPEAHFSGGVVGCDAPSVAQASAAHQPTPVQPSSRLSAAMDFSR